MRAFFKAPLCAASLAAVALLAACNKQQAEAPTPAAPASPPVAVVNGTPISRAEYDVYLKNLLQGKQQELTADQKGQVLDELISLQLLAAQGEKDGLQNDPDTQAQLQLLRTRVLADAESQKYIKTQQPSDADLHAEYDTAVGAMEKTEYKARHILVATKEQAEQVIKKLKGGAKFEDLAKTLSTDNGSKNNGGDLGWFNSARMVKPVGDAVKNLKKGEVTPEPVQTQYGWHVIQLEDTRDATPPPFEQVKPQITNNLIRKKLQAYVADLKKEAKIDKKLDTSTTGSAPVAPATPAAPPAPAGSTGESKP
ncbi:MAG: peptidylprolyl isomerase [Steroidobacteraceae bacterium]|jgi:peptidyl-prolyl cis-trans isomerase C